MQPFLLSMPTLTRKNNKEGLEMHLNGHVVHRLTWDQWRALNDTYPPDKYLSLKYDADRILVDTIQEGLPQHLGPDQMKPFTIWADEMLRGIPENERTYKIETSAVPIPDDKDTSMIHYKFILNNSP